MDLQEKKALISSYQSVFKSANGKKVLEHMSKMLGNERACIVPNDAYSTCFNDGMRNAYLQIKAIIDTDLSKMTEEQAAE